jgi:hypothetical protein
MPVSGLIKVHFNVAVAGASILGAAPHWNGLIEISNGFSDGVAVNQADKVYVAERTVASGANDDIDLTGSLADPLGATITAAELAALLIYNKPLDPAADNTTNLTIGGGSNPMVGFLGGTTPTIGPIRPGCFVLLGGVGNVGGLGAIAAGTADILRVANSSGAQAKYQIGVVARSS